jgi:tyrosyl-tRNA synthetase
MANEDKAKIEEILTRGVEDVIVVDSLRTKLESGHTMRVKFGIDPTSKNIHIGRAVVLRKLKAFQDLGHKIILIVGDFTSLIGDPSDKLEKRPMLTPEKVKENMVDYEKQLGKIIDLNKAEIHYNSEWLSGLTFDEVCRLAESFSVQQMLSRRNFKDRYDQGNEISLREFMYPLMQGYDSMKVSADIEIGGFDQLFNLKAGRIIQKFYGMKEQDILTCQMLEGVDGRKMSGSWGNVINVDDEPNDMFGKIMSLRDDLILKYFLLATNIPTHQIDEMEKVLDEGENPKNLKMKLAREIVGLYHGHEAAEKAEENFRETFEKGGVPEDIKEVRAGQGSALPDIFIKEGLIASKTEWRRLLDEGAVKIMTEDASESDNKKQKENAVTSDNAFFSGYPTTYKIGKRRFVKIIPE